MKKELVSRTKGELDRRSVDLLITQKGLNLLQEIEDDMMLTDFLPHRITAQEATQLSNMLDKLRGTEEDETVLSS